MGDLVHICVETTLDFDYIPMPGLVDNVKRCFNGSWMKEGLGLLVKTWSLELDQVPTLTCSLSDGHLCSRMKVHFVKNHNVSHLD